MTTNILKYASTWDNQSARIKSQSSHGRGLFATTDLGAGDLIFSIQRPLIAVLDAPRLIDTCSNCFLWSATPDAFMQGDENASLELKACAGCSVLYYCSKKCQTESWKRSHKSECKLLKAINSRGTLPNAARVVLQMIRLSEKDSNLPFSSLESHFDKIKQNGGDTFETLLVMSTGIHQYSGTKLDLEFVQRLFAIVLTNSLTLVSPTFDPLGVCLDPFAAMANHSCDPNAVVVHDGPILSVRTLKEIRKDEEIFISYVDCTNPFYRRQRELEQRFYFTCRCIKCTKGPGLLEDNFDKTLSEIGPLIEDSGSITDTDFKNPPSMDSADYVGRDPVSQKLGVLQRIAFEKLKSASSSTKTAQSLSSINAGLKVLNMAPIWPLHRQPKPSLLQLKFVTLLHPGKATWMQAFLTEIQTVCLIDPELFPQNFHPVRVVHQWTLAALVLFLSGQREDQTLYKDVLKIEADTGLSWGVFYMALISEVSENVDRSHGSESAFAISVKTRANAVVAEVTQTLGERKNFADHWKPKFAKQWAIVRRIAAFEAT